MGKRMVVSRRGKGAEYVILLSEKKQKGRKKTEMNAPWGKVKSRHGDPFCEEEEAEDRLKTGMTFQKRK